MLQTHECIQALQKSQRWAVTYWYCYPSLERWHTLKLMRKYAGRKFSWKEYLGEVEIGKWRVAAYLTTK